MSSNETLFCLSRYSKGQLSIQWTSTNIQPNKITYSLSDTKKHKAQFPATLPNHARTKKMSPCHECIEKCVFGCSMKLILQSFIKMYRNIIWSTYRYQYLPVTSLNFSHVNIPLTLILLTWKIWWAPNNASTWQMGFNLVFKGLMTCLTIPFFWDMTLYRWVIRSWHCLLTSGSYYLVT